jgi:6-pyruvoyltetrahydropterin/6-carboxytetrahydropterin synthase
VTSDITCTRVLEFDAGHRVWRHEGKCAHLHGHRYKVEVTARGTSNPTDELGRVIDFSVIKERLGTWIDKNWDHGMILYQRDHIAGLWEKHSVRADALSLYGQKFYLLPLNPTAENIAYWLISYVCPQLFEDLGIQVIKITVWETPNCNATVTL